MRRLPQELAGVGVENSFVRGGAIAAHQHAPVVSEGARAISRKRLSPVPRAA